jgi:hypothetical protein
MALISFSQNGLTPFQQLLGHNKDILEKWISLEECFFGRDTLSAKLKEDVSSQVKCTLFRQQMHTFSAPVF